MGPAGHLVATRTEDDLILNGFYVPADDTMPAVLLLHGGTANFYRLPYVHDLGRALCERGYAFLTVNTRGHDVITTIYRDDPNDSARRSGSAYERFADCVYDVRAWLDWLRRRGHSHVVLLGHSFGAAKATHVVARTHAPRVLGLGLLSPPDLRTLKASAPELFAQVLAWAQTKLDRGRPEALFVTPDGRFPPISAATAFDVAGPDAPAQIFYFDEPERTWPDLPDVTAPIFALLGTEGEYSSVPAAEALAALARQACSASSCTTRVVAGARHNYRGHEGVVATAVTEWIATLSTGK